MICKKLPNRNNPALVPGFSLRGLRGWFAKRDYLIPIIASLLIVGTTPTFANMPGTVPMLVNLAAGGGALSCTGGTVTVSGTNRIHTFTSSGTLNCTGNGTANFLAVAGGGSAGSSNNTVAGGGGAGGVLSGSTSLSAGSYTITVGAGGMGLPP